MISPPSFHNVVESFEWHSHLQIYMPRWILTAPRNPKNPLLVKKWVQTNLGHQTASVQEHSHLQVKSKKTLPALLDPNCLPESNSVREMGPNKFGTSNRFSGSYFSSRTEVSVEQEKQEVKNNESTEKSDVSLQTFFIPVYYIPRRP